jgi:hypothetical protein
MLQMFLDGVQTLHRILQDQAWGGLSAVVAIIFFLIERRREFSHKTIAHFTMKNDLLRHPQLGRVHSILWKIWNCGTEYIAANDYNGPIQFVFGGASTVVHDARAHKTEPPSRVLSYTKNGNAVKLDPVGLDSNEWIIMEFLVTPARDLKIDLQIAGRTIDVARRRSRFFEQAKLFRNVLLALLVPWFLSLVIYYGGLGHILLFYVLSLALVSLIVLLATLSIVYLILAIRGV